MLSQPVAFKEKLVTRIAAAQRCVLHERRIRLKFKPFNFLKRICCQIPAE